MPTEKQTPSHQKQICTVGEWRWIQATSINSIARENITHSALGHSHLQKQCIEYARAGAVVVDVRKPQKRTHYMAILCFVISLCIVFCLSRRNESVVFIRSARSPSLHRQYQRLAWAWKYSSENVKSWDHQWIHMNDDETEDKLHWPIGMDIGLETITKEP